MLSPCQLVYFAHTSHFISIGATLRALRNFLEQQNSIPTHRPRRRMVKTLFVSPEGFHDSRFDGGMTMAHSSHLTWPWRFCSCSLQSSCSSGSGRSLNRVLRCFSLRPGSVLHPWLQMIWLRQVHRFQRHDGAVQVCSSWTLAFCASSDAWLKPY